MIQWYKFLISVSLIICSQSQLCNLYPYNPTDCLDKTDQKCVYSYYENSCQSTQATILGCSQNLNKFACISQLTKNGSPSLCYFDGRCKDATDDHFRNLGCSELYSYHACLQQNYYLCAWVDEKCQGHNYQSYDCNRQVQVSPKVCSQLEITSCINGGMEQNYSCTEIVNFNSVKCSDSGLNKIACLKITTQDQSCVFNSYCQDLQDFTNSTCDMFINQKACLSITNPNQTCQWNGEKCIEIGVGLQCLSYKLVNQSVCSRVSDACYYNKGNCNVPTSDVKSCTTPGLSKTSCFALINNCRFVNNQCQEAKPLNVLRCDSTLNQQSCLNIDTYYQYCQWDNVNNLCTSVQITQSTSCNLSNVNGQLCKSIIKEPCKYDQSLFKCRPTEPYDTCKTPYLNLLGCVSITLSGNFCQWVSGQCQSNTITKYLTKCSSLAFSNPTSCQLVYHKDPNESNCFYDSNRQGCTSFIGQSNTLTCTTTGLSEIGCSNIRTPGNICRFYRGQCMAITDKAQMQSSSCIEVTSVNPQACALITFRQERCKYNSDTMSCITSVDIYRDGCEIDGLNSFGCAALVGSSCYFDYVNMQCKSIPAPQKQIILENTFCIKSYPTKDVCLSITQSSQLCTWIPQKSQCTDMQIVKWNYCVDYKMVNPNVCASVLVSDPNKNSNSGYCIFDSINYRCATTSVICTSTCCENISGINAHVCSRYSNATKYCYFGNDLRCHEMVLEDYTNTYAAQFINNNQIPCEYLNYSACNLVDWSKSQLCLQVSPDDRCHSVDFSKLTDYSPFFSSQAKVTKFTCSATTQGNIYFKYDYTNYRCQPVTTDQLFSCTTVDININICTRLTLSYCSWDLLTLSCIDAIDYLTHPNLVCSSVLNQNACNDFPNSPCYFDMNLNRCTKLITVDPTKGCSYYSVSNNITTAQLTCALINKLGEACLYDTSTNGCVNSTKQSSQCNVVGSNKFYCFSFTTPYCTWNSANNQCVAVPSSPDPTLAYSCTDGVNKSLCLAIKQMGCAWDNINYVCLSVPYTASLACTDLQNTNYLYNKISCTQVTKSGSNCHWSSNQCVETTSYIYQCTSPPMNINSCMSKTRKIKCIFQTGNCINFSGDLNIPCDSPGIGAEICSQIIGSTCMFSLTTNTCQTITINSSTQCSDLMDGNNYNKQSCISINPSVPINSSFAYNVCGSIFCGYQKYCYWDPDTYTCNTPFLATADSGYITSTVTTVDEDGNDVEETVLTPYCNIINTNFNLCDNSFSQAMCLELIQNSCFFDLTLGGCQLLTGFESLPQTCEKVNYLACSQITTIGLTCGTVPVVSDGCINPYLSPQICTTLSITPGTDCSSYQDPAIFVNSLVCSNLNGYCFWNGNQCQSISSGTYCDLVGLSIDACTDLGSCLSGPPCTSGGVAGGSVTCDDISNDGSITTIQKQYQCINNIISDGSITQSSVCLWNQYNETCSRLGIQYSCDQLAPYLQGQQACIQYTTLNNQGCMWTKYQCLEVSTTVYSCFNLNKYACRYMTSGVNCLWLDNQCQQSDSTTIATHTDCSIANKQACQYINSNCWVNNNACVQSSSNSSCSDVAKKSGNLKACIAVSQQGQFCFWNTIRNYCDYGPDQGQSCDSLGLNNQSCFRYTTGLCFFNGTCQFATSNNYQCSISNYNLCITNTQNACYWSSQQICGQIVYQGAPTCGSFYVLGSQTFNPLACAKIVGTNQTCYYTTYKGRNYCSQITTGDCSVVGINALACLTITNTQCQFDQSTFVCSQVTDFNQNCAGGFNQLACVGLTAQICYFNNSCQVFDFSSINSGNVVAQTTQYKYNYQVCQKINLPNIFMYYDTNTFKCVNYIGAATLRCSQIGLNLQGCIYKTSQNCMFDSGVCKIVYDNFLSLYSCDQYTFNFQTCMNLSQSTCKFENSQCSPTVGTENCQDLTTQIVNQYACTSQQSTACSYNPSTNKCISQTSTTLACTTTGLNKLGCLSNTTTQRCLYDSVNNICKEAVLSTYKCTDLINIKNCAQVTVAGEYCYFNNACQKFSNSDLLTCVKAFKHNAPSCPHATDQPCSYDTTNQMCRISPGNEDCASDHTLNQQACSSNTGPSKCYWDGNNCIATTSANLSTILSTKNCSDSINKNICVAITTTNQYCQFSSTCQNKQYNDNANTCAALTYINRYEFCEFVIDQPCQYDQASQSCKVLSNTDIISQCERGLNRLACLNNVQQQCLFQSFCYSSSQIAVCEQAQSEIQCLGLIDLPCMWQINQCINFDSSTTPCATLNTYKVVSVVCFTSLVVPPFVCSYDKVTSFCNQIQPTSCSDINEKQSCKLFSTFPCLWKNNQCQFTLLIQGASSCSDVGSIGTERACKDVNKYGQNCKYYAETGTCDALDTFTSCDDPVNYQSCISQINAQCQWTTTMQMISAVQYTSGICQSISDLTLLGCSPYLSFLTCLSITLNNQFCYFFDQKCQTIVPTSQIGLYDYTIINQNVCSLVTTQAAQYDAQLRACRPLTDFNCQTPGINRIGCIQIQDKRCRWQSLKYECTQDVFIQKNSCLDSDVSQLICTQCNGNPVQWINGNCAQLKLDAKCTDLGINKDACLRITAYPCQWLDDKCQNYSPLFSCDQIPTYVNARVCALAPTGKCKFNGLNSCITTQDSDTCTTNGLNQQGCVSISGCAFDGKCYKFEDPMKCLQIGVANQDVCSLATDVCKYDPISLKCIQPSITDNCGTQGISVTACENIFNCEYTENKCSCSLIDERYPKCDLIQGQIKCGAQSHCFTQFINYIQGQESFSVSTCRDLTCADMKQCHGSYLQGLPCYMDIQSKCQQAKSCSNINSDSCNLIVLGQLCVRDQDKCTDLICENLTTVCPKDYCYINGSKCYTLECSKINQTICSNRSDCYWNGEICQNQDQCTSVTNLEECSYAKYKGRQCGWIDSFSICTDTPCRFMGKSRGACEGIQTEGEICVILSDLSCVACEEISDPCICLQHSEFCDMQNGTNKCFSKLCSSFLSAQCPNYCRIVDQKCVPQCNKIYNLNSCLNGNNCVWDPKFQTCNDFIQEVIINEQILPEYTQYAIIGIIFCIILF